MPDQCGILRPVLAPSLVGAGAKWCSKRPKKDPAPRPFQPNYRSSSAPTGRALAVRSTAANLGTKASARAREQEYLGSTWYLAALAPPPAFPSLPNVISDGYGCQTIPATGLFSWNCQHHDRKRAEKASLPHRGRARCSSSMREER